MMRKLSSSQEVGWLVNESVSNGVKLIAAVEIRDCCCLFYAGRWTKTDGREEKT